MGMMTWRESAELIRTIWRTFYPSSYSAFSTSSLTLNLPPPHLSSGSSWVPGSCTLWSTSWWFLSLPGLSHSLEASESTSTWPTKSSQPSLSPWQMTRKCLLTKNKAKRILQHFIGPLPDDPQTTVDKVASVGPLPDDPQTTVDKVASVFKMFLD